MTSANPPRDEHGHVGQTPTPDRGRLRGLLASPHARLVAQAWLGSRLVLLVAGLAVAATTGRSLPHLVTNWDVVHFLRIAREGYVITEEVAFFPGLPLLLRAAETLAVPAPLAGIVLSVVGSAAAAAALFRLGGGGTTGGAAAIAWLLAPNAVFTVVPYTESLFCAFAFWAWDRARADRWSAAAALAAGACAMRVSGLFLVGALGLLILTRGVRPRWDSAVAGYPIPDSWRNPGWLAGTLHRLAWLLVPGAVLFAYAAYLRVTQGSWTVWFDAQAQGWGRTATAPYEAWRQTAAAATPGYFPTHPTWYWLFRAELAAVIIGLVAVVALILLRRWAEAGWIAVQLAAFSSAVWFISVSRAVLLWFPVWLLIGELVGRPLGSPAARRARALVVGLFALGALALMARWAVQFYLADWAG